MEIIIFLLIVVLPAIGLGGILIHAAGCLDHEMRMFYKELRETYPY